MRTQRHPGGMIEHTHQYTAELGTVSPHGLMNLSGFSKRGEWPNFQGSHSLENTPTSNVIGLALQMDTSNASLVTQVLMQMVPVHC